jgi:5-formyltetrahydrofolate cyclo-ligase
MSQPAATASKEDWRAWAQQARAEIDWPAVSIAVNAALANWAPLAEAQSALLYLPMAAEVNLQPLQESDLKCRWLTTRTPRSGNALTIHELGGPLEVHPFGFLQPHHSAPEVHPLDVEVFLVPALAFDLWGNRLGRGAGFYDRLLAMVRPEAALVGITPASLVVDQLPLEQHDIPMTHLATDEGVIETARI